MTNKKEETRLPSDYEAPKSVSNYLKLQDGQNKFRIMSSPIMGYIERHDKQPNRTRECPDVIVDTDNPPKFFWAMVVWSYDNEQIQILEITQKSIQQAIEGLVADPDFGSPLEYDLKITRTGKQLETKYTVNPLSKSEISGEIMGKMLDKTPKLDKLFEGGDPFD